jgi:polygalacturonase
MKPDPSTSSRLRAITLYCGLRWALRRAKIPIRGLRDVAMAAPRAAFLAVVALLLLLPAARSTRVFSVGDYGAAGDGSRYDTAAIQAAVDACAAAGGGRVLLPAPGDYLTATVHLRSRVVLEVAPGARLLGGTRQQDYPAESSRWYVVLAESTTGAGVAGGGEINGQGGAFVVAPNERKNVMVSWNATGDCVGDECRPRLVGFIDSKDVRVHDITLNQPAYWW